MVEILIQSKPFSCLNDCGAISIQANGEEMANRSASHFHLPQAGIMFPIQMAFAMKSEAFE